MRLTELLEGVAFDDLDESQLRALLDQRHRDRRGIRERKNAAQTAVKPTKAMMNKTEEALAALSPQQLAAIVAKLGVKQ